MKLLIYTLTIKHENHVFTTNIQYIKMRFQHLKFKTQKLYIYLIVPNMNPIYHWHSNMTTVFTCLCLSDRHMNNTISSIHRRRIGVFITIGSYIYGWLIQNNAPTVWQLFIVHVIKQELRKTSFCAYQWSISIIALAIVHYIW